MIYLLAYKCRVKQYVRKITDEFRLRWNNYKNNDKKMYGMMHVYRNICLSISKVNVTVFLGNVSITLIDKTNGKDPIKRENYWMRALKIYARLSIEDTAWLMSCRSINVTGAFTFLVFFGILFRRGTDLGQEFSDMKYVFLFIVLFVSLLLIYYFT